MRTAGLADRSPFIAVLLIACAAHAYAQPPSGAIAGLVVDARTMQPLGGVLVELCAPRQDARERPDIDIAAAHPAPDLLPRQLRSILLRRRERRRAGPFRQVVREAKRRAHAFLERRLVERDDVVQLLLEDAERQIERDARRHPFGERIDALRRHALRAPP